VYAILKMNEALRKLDARKFANASSSHSSKEKEPEAPTLEQATESDPSNPQSMSLPLPAGEDRGEGEPVPADFHVKIFNATQPFTDHQPAMKWDGEWHITIEVFRDLGLAFGAVLVLIYVLMVGWFRSFLTPVIVMVAIPFSLVGILPAHGALNAFFTATSMIGFMAGAGIVVRNSIILVDFIEQRLAEGLPMAEAVVDAGAVRFRPMLLTALAVVVGAGVILFDPIFQGLAISLMAGEVASLLISRMAVPVLYYMAYCKRVCPVVPAVPAS
jgi:hypothetical protein